MLKRFLKIIFTSKKRRYREHFKEVLKMED